MRTAPTTAVLGGLCVVALGVATNVATSVLPDTWRPYLWIAWPALAVLIILFIIVEVRRAGGGTEEVPVTSTRSRAVLLERVHRYWIKGVLERSFYQQARIELGLEITVDAVHPWDIIATEPDHEPRLLPPGTTMRTVFNDLDRTMLVLGAPGSGKTTMLLELLRDLLAAAADRDEPIPVLLNLASWAQRRESLEEWIVREVSERYEVATRHVRAWLAADELLPLLDGLDEVADAHREACVGAINEFRRAHGTVSIAVCCRTNDYQELDANLRMYGTLRLQPLTSDQVVSFLDRFGPTAAGARTALATQPELRELMSSPLMLSVLVLAYRSDTPVESGHFDDTTRLFRTFVVTMLRRRPSQRYSPHQIVFSLAHLAYQQRLASQTQFTIDLISYFWMPYRQWNLPKRLADMVCAVFGLLVLTGAGYATYGWRGAVAGAVAGLAFGIPAAERNNLWHLQHYVRLREGKTASDPPVWGDWLFSISSVVYGPADHPRVGAVAAPIGIVAGALLGWSDGWLPAATYAAATALAVLVTAWLSYNLAYDIRRLPARLSGRELPSPKVRVALRTAVPIAALIGLVAGALAWLTMTLLTDVNAGPFALLVGIGATAYAVSCLGLFAFVEQAATRLVLRNADVLPLRAKPLLDHATRCLFLHKVGDSYLFSHQKLLDFFEGLRDPFFFRPDSPQIEDLVGR